MICDINQICNMVYILNENKIYIIIFYIRNYFKSIIYHVRFKLIQ